MKNYPTGIFNKIVQLSFISLIISVFVTCSGPKEMVPYVIPSTDFVLEGPLYEGSNTVQVAYSIDVASILEPFGAKDVKAIKKVSLKAANFKGTSNLSEHISSLVFNLAAENVDMLQIAVLNPLADGVSDVQLTPAAEADLAAFFQQKDVFLVLDVNLKHDMEESLTLTGNFEFEVGITN